MNKVNWSNDVIKSINDLEGGKNDQNDEVD